MSKNTGGPAFPVTEDVTSAMKARFIGEFSWEEEDPYYDENGNVVERVATRVVPWDLCKRIYKEMSAFATTPTQEAVVGYCLKCDKPLRDSDFFDSEQNGQGCKQCGCDDIVDFDPPLYLAPPANDHSACHRDGCSLANVPLRLASCACAAPANGEAVRRIEAALKYNRSRDTYTDLDEQFRRGCVHGLERALAFLTTHKQEGKDNG